MSELELSKEQKQQAEMEGGFAVVDRERLIEEEVYNVVPWHKHVIHLFTAPSKMMEDCFGIEPSKGASIGVMGTMLFTTIYMLFTMLNPINRVATYELLRANGIQETQLEQSYSVSTISGTIGGIIGVFIGILFTAILFNIMKAILKDKGKFATIYKMLLVMNTVVMAIQCLDAGIAWIVGVDSGVFSIKFLMSEAMRVTVMGKFLSSTVTIAQFVGIVYMVIGYKAITHSSTKKAVIATTIVEGVSLVVTYFMASLGM